MSFFVHIGLTHPKVEPLTVLGCVEIRPEVELVVSLSDPDHLGQVAGFEPGLKL